MSSSGIHTSAQTGFAKSAAYDQHRPAYSPSIVKGLVEQLGVLGKKHATILDLAAGTGKFTESLVARQDEEYQIIAVEPHADMRKVLEEKKLPGVTVKDGKADSIPLDDESVDAVICAQAFHWFANMESLREIHRVLQPHGALGLVWNLEDYNSGREHKAATVWEGKILDLTWAFEDRTPRARHGQWREVFDEQVKSSPLALLIANDQLFSLPLSEQVEKWEVWLTKEQVWERYSTLSHCSVLQGEERERVYKTFMDAINGAEVETDKNGRVAVHGETLTCWTTKIPSEGRAGVMEVERPTE